MILTVIIVTSFSVQIIYKYSMKMNSDVKICCHPFDTTLWHVKTHVWNKKLFLQDKVKLFMHVPLNMGSVIKRMFKKIEQADAMPETQDFLMLTHDTSLWNSELYMTVSKNVPNENMSTLSGTFFSRVYDGPYHHVPKWIADMDAYLASKKQKALKYYLHYAYCPKCAKKFGHNYCVVFAKID